MRRLSYDPEMSGITPPRKIRPLGKTQSGVPWYQGSPNYPAADFETSAERGLRPVQPPPKVISPIELPAPPPPPPPVEVPEVVPPPEFKPVIPPDLPPCPEPEPCPELPPIDWYPCPEPEVPAAEPCPRVDEMELCMLRELLVRKAKIIECYMEIAEELKCELGEFFLCEAKDEIEHFKLILGMLGHLDASQADELENCDLRHVLAMAADLCCYRSNLGWNNERSQDNLEVLHRKHEEEEREEKGHRREHYRHPRYYYRARKAEHSEKYREVLTRAVQLEAEIICLFEEYLCRITNPDIQNLLVCIIRQDKNDLAQFSCRLLKLYH